jgi:hypothetical protein
MRLHVGLLEGVPFQGRLASGGQIAERAGADGGQQGGAVGGTFLAINRTDGKPVDVGPQLPADERALGAAPGEQQALDRRQLADDLDAVAHAEADALEDGTGHLGGGEADEDAAGGGVAVRRAFAGRGPPY